MTTTVALVVAVLLVIAVPALQAGAGWATRAPRLGILAWRAVTVAALTATATAMLTALLHWERDRRQPA